MNEENIGREGRKRGGVDNKSQKIAKSHANMKSMILSRPLQLRKTQSQRITTLRRPPIVKEYEYLSICLVVLTNLLLLYLCSKSKKENPKSKRATFHSLFLFFIKGISILLPFARTKNSHRE